MKNYFSQIMDDSFKLLEAKKVNWPIELDKQQKILLLNKCLEYFEFHEDYDKCTALQRKIQIMSRKRTRRKS
jgi:hypothetical protein